GEPTLTLLTHELVHAAFLAEDTFPSAEFYGNVVTDVLGRNLQCMYGDEHRINRALVSPAFRQRLMPALVGRGAVTGRPRAHRRRDLQLPAAAVPCRRRYDVPRAREHPLRVAVRPRAARTGDGRPRRAVSVGGRGRHTAQSANGMDTETEPARRDVARHRNTR